MYLMPGSFVRGWHHIHRVRRRAHPERMTVAFRNHGTDLMRDPTGLPHVPAIYFGHGPIARMTSKRQRIRRVEVRIRVARRVDIGHIQIDCVG